MLRDRSLHPLSHQHQHGLALCVLVDRGLRKNSSPDNVATLAKRITDSFEIELRNHFELEERLLFPAIREHLGETPTVDDLLADHRKLERLAGRLRTIADLRAFTSLLRAHIRREERELFEDIQNRLPREVLDRLGRAFEEQAVRVCL
jgi:hemerythrin-like domain-containing protein